MHVCKQDTRMFGFVGPKADAAESWDPNSTLDSISAALTHTQTRAHARESLCASLENNSIQDSHGSPAWAGQHPLLDVPSLHQAEPSCFLYIYIYMYTHVCIYTYTLPVAKQTELAGTLPGETFYRCSGWLGFVLVSCWDVFQEGSLGRLPDADPLF